MQADGLQLASGSNIERSLPSDKRGNQLPVSGTDGDEFQLLVAHNGRSPGIYFYSADDAAWIVKYPNNDVMPYDIVAATYGTIRAGDTIGRHLAVRSFKVNAGFENCIAYAITPAAEDVTFTLYRVSRSGAQTSIGTVFFSASESVGVFTQNGSGLINFSAGEHLIFQAPTPVDQFISDVTISIAGTLV